MTIVVWLITQFALSTRRNSWAVARCRPPTSSDSSWLRARCEASYPRNPCPMKITALETIQLPHLNNILWLHVHTDEGLIGLGETFRGADAVATYLHKDVAPLLIGRNPLEIDAIS